MQAINMAQGCAEVVINGVKHNLGAIGGGAVVLGLFQVRCSNRSNHVCLLRQRLIVHTDYWNCDGVFCCYHQARTVQ